MKLAFLVAAGALLIPARAATAAQQPQPAPPDRFVDVPTDHWAYEAVENLRKRGIIVGYPDGQMRGKRTITRYEAAVGLDRVLKTVTGGQTRTTVVPGPRGPQGPPGPQGPAGPPGPRGQRPPEMDMVKQILVQLDQEVEQLRKELSAAEQKLGGTESKVKR